jgi:hypothetical protein
MLHTSNAYSDDSMDTPEASRVTEIGLAPDGGSFSIVARNGAKGPAQVSLLAGEVPRLIVALLRTAEALERQRGGERSLVFPIEKGSITVWESHLVFRVTLTASASMTFQLSRGAAASLFEALATAFGCSTLAPSTTH